MKKNIKILIAFVAILAILIAALIFILSSPKKNDSETVEPDGSINLSKIFNNEINDIASINIKNSGGEFTISATFENDNIIYNLEPSDPTKQPSQSIIKTSISELINLIPSKKVEEKTDNLNKYGLDTNLNTIKVNFKDNSSKTLILGNEAPLALGNYLKISEDDSIYLLAKANTEIFTNPKEFYMENKN